MSANGLKCTNESVGHANQLFSQLISTVITAQCSISPTSMWPNDYGPKIVAEGFVLTSDMNIF